MVCATRIELSIRSAALAADSCTPTNLLDDVRASYVRREAQLPAPNQDLGRSGLST
jgi:hypothetical protein